MNEQQLLSFAVDFNTLPLETRWLLRGIQLGMKLSAEVDRSKLEEAVRCGIHEAANTGASAGSYRQN